MKRQSLRNLAVLFVILSTVVFTGCGKKNDENIIRPGTGVYPGGTYPPGGYPPGGYPPGGYPPTAGCVSPYAPIAFVSNQVNYTGISLQGSFQVQGNIGAINQFPMTGGMIFSRGLNDGMMSASGQIVISLSSTGGYYGGYGTSAGTGAIQLSQAIISQIQYSSGGYGGYGQQPCITGIDVNFSTTSWGQNMVVWGNAFLRMQGHPYGGISVEF